MRFFYSSATRFLVVFAFFSIAGRPLWAQTNNGGITGTILDSSGAAISGAEVVATGAETHTVYTTTSTSTGAYRFLDLVLGTYNIAVTAKGFKTADVTGVVVQINTTASLDITLQPGEVREALTVVADAPRIQAETSEMGTVVGAKEIEELPLSLNASGQSFLRSPETFVFLAPGTQGPGTNQNGSTSAGIFQSKLTGGQNFSTEVLLDGVSTTRSDSGSAFDQTAPSVEALSEFKVLTSTFSAEFGRTSGGIESFAIKSGTNGFHGTAFDLFRNTVLDANSWNNNFNGAPRPADHQNDFGGSLGGPVWIPKFYNGRDKTFFFFEWEQYRNNPGTSSLDTLPIQNELQNGDFSALLGPVLTDANHNPLLNPCDNTPVRKGEIFNPATTSCPTGFVGGRIAFPGNIVPPSSWDPVAKKILSFLTVLPNQAPTPQNLNGLQNNFLYLSSQHRRDTTMTFRIDQNLGSKNKLFFSYSSRDQGTPNGADDLPGPLNGNFFNINFTHYLRFGWDDTISTNWLNTFTIGLNRLNNLSKAASVNGTDWPAALGISNASGTVFPQISFNGSPLSIGYTGFSTESNNGHVPNSLVTADNVSWVHGRHYFHFGSEWRAYQYSFIGTGDTSPNYGFNNFQTAFAPNDANTGDPFASFLLGLPNQAQLSITSVNPRLDSNYFALYIQDDYKIRRNLMLNLGLRYDFDTPRNEAHGAQSNLDLTAPNSAAGGLPGALVYTPVANQGGLWLKDFGPRIGFAYSPDQLFGSIRNVVIRGGYGIYYAALFYDDLPTGTIQFSSGTTVQPTFTSGNSFTPVQALSAGFPSFTPPKTSTDPTLLNGQNVGYIANSYGRPGMTQNWSLEIQKQLATDLILSVGYVGIKGDHLHTNIAQINALQPQYYSLGKALSDSVTSTTGQAVLTSLGVTVPSWFEPLYGPGGVNPGNDTVAQILRPFPQYLDIGGSNNSKCACLENLGTSTYNALQAKLERRFRNGLNLLASYTYSKTLTNADSAIPVFSGFSSNDFAAQNPFNPKSQKALSYQDTPHTLVLSYLYELPAGPGKRYLSRGVASKVLGGWQIGGVQRYQSGTPTILNTFVTSPPGTDGAFRLSLVPGVPLLAPNHGSFNASNTNAANSGCLDNPDGTMTPNSSNNFFNCAAFMDPNAPNLVAQRGFVYGNAPLVLGNVRSQHYFNEDFAIQKRTPLHENHAIVFKADIPNAFNRHVFGTLDGWPGDNTFGAPKGLSVVSPVRQIQFTLRYEF
jgi:Carboxypeptidase regulatory-like domain